MEGPKGEGVGVALVCRVILLVGLVESVAVLREPGVATLKGGMYLGSIEHVD